MLVIDVKIILVPKKVGVHVKKMVEIIGHAVLAQTFEHGVFAVEDFQIIGGEDVFVNSHLNGHALFSIERLTIFVLYAGLR
jgi:hypothetical protein